VSAFFFFLSTVIQEYSTDRRGKAKWIGHILRRNRLLEHDIERKIEVRMEVTGNEEEDVSSYWMTLRKREDTV
jgi:hypothetical protein